jgi:hypothetical protein
VTVIDSPWIVRLCAFAGLWVATSTAPAKAPVSAIIFKVLMLVSLSFVLLAVRRVHPACTTVTMSATPPKIDRAATAASG